MAGVTRVKVEGGCFCGAVRYEAEGEPIMKGQCHCRQCQFFAGGSPNLFLAMPIDGFAYTSGTPKPFARPDAPVLPATRDFCAICGTHLVTHAQGLPAALIKVGTLDDPGVYGGAEVAVFTSDRQAFHQIAEGIAAFDKLPPM